MVVGSIESSPERVRAIGERLLNEDVSFAKRYRCLFALMNLKPSELTRKPLLEALADTKHGALMRHEVAYVLGQMQDKEDAVVSLLVKVLKDESDDPMVRHECAEALGNIATETCKTVLHDHLKDSCREVAETCELAVRKIADVEKEEKVAAGAESQFDTVDPALVSKAMQERPVAELEALALDETAGMHERYEAIFAIRNKGGTLAVDLLSKCLSSSSSALLKHEVAFVLGQLQNVEATEILVKILRDKGENPMVRHEAAEALGSVAERNKSICKILEDFCSDEVPEVAQSCIVALDMLENQENFEYLQEVA